MKNDYIVWFKHCSHQNKNQVGGKNCNLGELYRLSQLLGFNIANGFAITTMAYERFIEYNKLENDIIKKLETIDFNDIDTLQQISNDIKSTIISGKMPEDMTQIINASYQDLSNLYNTTNLSVAVRSSAICEDLQNLSFAGQQDTYLNVTGESDLILYVKWCFASLFNARAISYRYSNNIDYSLVKISVGIQKMIRSDIGSAGVAFSIDTETGYNKAIIINSSFGLGEAVVSGLVKPDEVIIDKRTINIIDSDPIIMKKKGDKKMKIIYKVGENNESGVEEVETTQKEYLNFSITNNQSITLARIIYNLEHKYCQMLDMDCGIDVEWAIDGSDNKVYIIQTRPETVHSVKNNHKIHKYVFDKKLNETDLIISGVAVGSKISTGKTNVLASINDHKQFKEGDILVTDMTTPDWEPLMKISSGIITNKGGRTCHAAIVARELGINAIVGTGNATELYELSTGTDVTMTSANGEEGKVYKGIIDYHIETLDINANKKIPVNLMLNVGNPEASFIASQVPNNGVGLARLEFIISTYIKIHPLALCAYPNLDNELRDTIHQMIGSHDNGRWYFIKRLARGISKIASAFYPNDTIVRLSDFKSNEYRNLVGGTLYEPNEENPMIGWRGAARYYSKDYIKGFQLECEAIKYAREIMKMDNIIVMIPFCRTPDECQEVLNTMERFGLTRGTSNNGEKPLKVYLMCEIPSNVIEADLFSPMIDGVSIGGNDLLQLTLGIDRDSNKINYLSQHTNISYRRMISMAIKTYKKYGIKVGFCGQQPSYSTEFAQFLIDEGIDSISVIPDSAITVIDKLGQ